MPQRISPVGSSPGGERQALAAEPEPDATRGVELGEAVEDGADRAGDGGIGVEADLAVALAPDQADRQTPPQLAAGRLIANATVEPGAQDVQLGLGHRALEPQHQTIVEGGGMIDTIGVADQGVGHAAQVEQSIPVGVVAGKARDLEPEHDPDVAKTDLRGQAGEATPVAGSGTRKAEILVDHDHA